jgi:hypothetical protein
VDTFDITIPIRVVRHQREDDLTLEPVLDAEVTLRIVAHDPQNAVKRLTDTLSYLIDTSV